MFKFLKEKIKSWIKTSEEKIETKEKAEKTRGKKKWKKETKQEKYKAKEEKKPEKKAKDKKEIEKEWKVSEEVIEDIKKEKLEIKSIEEKIKEKILEEKKEEFEEKPGKKGFFTKIKERLISVKISEEEFEEIFTRLELILLENNTALEVVEKIRRDLKEKLVEKEIKRDELEKEIINSLKSSIENILIEPENILEKIKSKTDEPFVIAFFGINGSGKTTSIAKLANLLKENKISCILAAADTFRAAAIDQLEKHGDRLGIKVIKSQYGADPTSVAFDAVKYAKAHKINAVLIDTAGRMHTKENLIREMEKIIRIIKPDLKIFIAESIAGNDIIEQARTFNEAAQLDGIILSKADVDEKGGSTISISYIIKKPIFFLGTGQEYKDLEPFNKEKIIQSLGLE
ncbi:signal recognition particle-docking protein FtsY [Candidatus Woesearchaeota archaeon CG10_big_fil_rev_8_21_14_0_10_34_12]|nr:MAG: signal recognition particle-docking protein FtsY [Candidatus Woesearchaeota archaeon CG10_big_fil_rev_8_21_14_0_10_34_12]